MWDAIVIGSGMGGMTAAGLLAGVDRSRVLVLEKHTEPGGQTHVFRRAGASWDVGLHYVGQIAPGSWMRSHLDYLSGGQLQWNRMPEDLERFIYPDIDLRVPSDPAKFQERLIALFPQEERAIRRYLRDVRSSARWATTQLAQGMMPKVAASAVQLGTRVTGRTATLSTKAYLKARFRSKELRALLVSQWGDYGLPPARSAFAIHALIANHYLEGAWFPRGGSAQIARTFERGIEDAGGVIRVGQDVQEILTEGTRAVGVRAIDRRGAAAREVTYRAPIVISAVGAQNTYLRLLPTTGPVGAATRPMRSLLGSLPAGLSTVTLYLKLSKSASTLGIEGENYWISQNYDQDDVAENSRRLLAGDPQHIYVSFPSLKSGEDAIPTAEIISTVDPDLFRQWSETSKGNRGGEYTHLKQTISDGLLRVAEQAIPGFTDLVEYAELSTPLSVEHYTSHPGGRFYGVAASPARHQAPPLGPESPLDGLWLAGEDAAALGILGAMFGGVAAASRAMGSSGFPRIQAALRKGQVLPDHRDARPRGDKRRATLRSKERLTSSIWRIELTLEGELPQFAAGQYARIHVGHDEWRDYSIADLEGQTLTFLISTATGGHGSRFFDDIEQGASTLVELPLGQFTLAPSSNHRVFIATGTGLAPFSAMFAQLGRQGTLREAELYFGCRTHEDDLTTRVPILPGSVVTCTSRANPGQGGESGRVTDVLAARDFDWGATDFYVCGSPAMVADTVTLLQDRGAHNLYIEPY